jgi:opacity protein-like surface antigen
MKVKIKAYLTLMLVVLLSWTNQAIAGGDYYSGAGSVKDYGGTPVPAPIPVPVYDPVWYLRADLGIGFGDGPSVSESGMVFGERAATYEAIHSFGPGQNSISSDFDQQAGFGVGVGFRWSDSFRMDVTGESRRSQTIKMIDQSSGDLLPATAHPSGTIVSETDDRSLLKGGVVMLNGYYDLPSHWGGFTPYIGGGLGFAVTDIKRRNLNTETVNYIDATGNHASTPLHEPSRTTASSTEVSFAAMATAGLTYRLSDITDLDLNYRYMFIDGVSSSLNVNGHTSTLEVDGTSDHQIRAGLRFNIQ